MLVIIRIRTAIPFCMSIVLDKRFLFLYSQLVMNNILHKFNRLLLGLQVKLDDKYILRGVSNADSDGAGQFCPGRSTWPGLF